MKRMGNNQWPLMFDASLDEGRTSEKWLLQLREYECKCETSSAHLLEVIRVYLVVRF